MAKVTIDGKEYEFPVIEGTEGERGIDISKLRAQTGFITLDSGYGNTGSCSSAITFINGEQGILRYRGIPIAELAENSTFIETALLLIYGLIVIEFRDYAPASVMRGTSAWASSTWPRSFGSRSSRSRPTGVSHSRSSAASAGYTVPPGNPVAPMMSKP